MIVDKNDPDYRAFEIRHNRQMERLKSEIIRILADHPDPRGMLDDELREALKQRVKDNKLPADLVDMLAIDGWLGSLTFSILLVQLAERKIVEVYPVQGVGFFHRLGPLDKLAAQG